MADIKIPALGESVAGGQISKWHFKDGDSVKVGDVLLTLETDKVAAEVTAEFSGTLTIARKEGDDVEVGGVVGSIAEGAAAPAAPAPTASPAPVAEAPKAADVVFDRCVHHLPLANCAIESHKQGRVRHLHRPIRPRC